jgi:hypothetical protein
MLKAQFIVSSEISDQKSEETKFPLQKLSLNNEIQME